MSRVVEVLRQAGLPLAVETAGQGGVFLTRGDGFDGPGTADHVAISWHAADALYDASDAEGIGTRGPAERLLCAVDDAMDTALAAILRATGLKVGIHPRYEVLAVRDDR